MPRQSMTEMPARPLSPALSILVVDDEQEIAALLADLLALDGHQVATAPDGRAALERLAQQGYDLILSDVRMPALDGPGLYREIERRHPELLPRVVFVTGNVLAGETEAFLARTGARCLRKPFVMAEIRQLIGALLPTEG